MQDIRFSFEMKRQDSRHMYLVRYFSINFCQRAIDLAGHSPVIDDLYIT